MLYLQGRCQIALAAVIDHLKSFKKPQVSYSLLTSLTAIYHIHMTFIVHCKGRTYKFLASCYAFDTPKIYNFCLRFCTFLSPNTVVNTTHLP